MTGDYEPVGVVRGTLRIVASVVAALAVVGLLSLASYLTRSERPAVNRVDVGDVSQLSIRSRNSDLKIVEGHSDRLVIRAKVTDGLSSTTYELHRSADGDEISIVGRCAQWLSPGCGVSATVEVPKQLPLVITSGSGDVRAVGLKDRVVNVYAGSGRVIGERLSVQELSVQADSSDVSATFSRQPYALKVSTADGNISAKIPDGKIKYLVNVASKSGRVHSSLANQKNGRGIVKLLSDSGDINVTR